MNWIQLGEEWAGGGVARSEHAFGFWGGPWLAGSV